MRIKSEKELLDPKVRKTIIEEIESSEEQSRRDEAYKRQQCYRDQTKRFVVETLLNQFEQTTVNQMSYAISNISIIKKIIDKLARVYSNGVDRTVGESEELTESLQDLTKKLDVDTQMKLVNRMLKLHKNTLLYIKPCPYEKQGSEYMGVKLEPLSPHLYSVVEGYNDRTRPMAVILSNYEQRAKWRVSLEPSKEGRTYNTPQPNPRGNNRDEIIADVAEDAGLDDKDKKRFVWWSDSYHFTTNGKGEIIDTETGRLEAVVSEDMIENPIEELPFVDFAKDRDGSYWAYGGDDLVDGGILVNCLISNLNHIAVTQGYGQLVLSGKNLPNNILLGPDKAIKLEYEKEEDPVPTVEFLNANAPLAQLQSGIEMYVALLLTTNNLSTTGISMQLQGSSNLASGIALMIDKSESQEDVMDQQQVFLDNEPEVFKKINKWIQVIKGSDKLIDPDLEDIELPEGFEDELQVSFGDPAPIVSESEHLDNLKKRKELGISTMIDILKMDQPGLTDSQAEEKLKKIMEEKLERAQSMMGDMIEPGVDDDETSQGGQDNLTEEDNAEREDSDSES